MVALLQNCVLVIATTALWSATGQPPPDNGKSLTSREESLWEQIIALSDEVPRTRPFEQWFERAEQRRATLHERLRLYLTLYPGGVHRDEALRMDLTTLFELGAMRGGDFSPLCQRVREILAAPPSPAAKQAASYWQIICDRAQAPTSQPSTRPSVPALDLLPSYRAFIQRFPTDRHVPRLAVILFEQAERKHDRDTMRAMVRHLSENFPDHTVTALLQARWRIVESVGRPFAGLRFTATDGTPIDTRAEVGRPVIIIIWAAFDQASCERAEEIEQFRRSHPDLRVIGVSLDEMPEKTDAEARALGLTWPQWNDGSGWANPFVREWGVQRLPFVLVLDRAGRLVGAGSDTNWISWAQRALPDSDAPDRDPD